MRRFYDRLNMIILDNYEKKDLDLPNAGVHLLSLIKRGDLDGLKRNLEKIESLNLENTVDDFGEIEFSDREIQLLTTLLETSDTNIVRRLDPIRLALLYN